MALVTGASRGIGRSIAERLASSGHRVVVNYASSETAAKEVVAGIEAAGGQAIAIGGDVGDEDDVASMLSTAEAAFGPVEILVNNAGVTRDGLLMRMAPEDWDEVIRVDLRSVYVCSRAVLRSMVKARWGRIISIASVSGLAGNPGQTNYAAAKAGMVGFSKSLAKEVGSRGITVNVVAPGFIDTDMTDALGPDIRDGVAGRIAVGRMGTPSEIASAVGYLAADEASYITGQVLVVDGGLAL